MKHKNKIRSLTAKTFTPKYDELEDRLRVVINYDDINNRVDFMLTRSFILNLIPSTDDYILKYYNLEQERVDTPKSILQKDNQKNKTISETDGVNLELYKTDEELLRKVNFNYDKISKKTLVTFFSQNTVAKASLDGHMMQQIFSVIKLAIPYYSWGISHNF